MLITQSDYSIIEERLKARYQDAGRDQLHELVAETVWFLAQDDHSKLTKSLFKRLARHLRWYRNQQLLEMGRFGRKRRSRTIKVGDLDFGFDRVQSDDDKLSALALPSNVAGRTDGDELEKLLGLSDPERERLSNEEAREHWRPYLSAIEFEALSIMTGSNQARCLTTSLSRRGLGIYFRRARIRMKWIEFQSSKS